MKPRVTGTPAEVRGVHQGLPFHEPELRSGLCGCSACRIVTASSARGPIGPPQSHGASCTRDRPVFAALTRRAVLPRIGAPAKARRSCFSISARIPSKRSARRGVLSSPSDPVPFLDLVRTAPLFGEELEDRGACQPLLVARAQIKMVRCGTPMRGHTRRESTRSQARHAPARPPPDRGLQRRREGDVGSMPRAGAGAVT